MSNNFLVPSSVVCATRRKSNNNNRPRLNTAQPSGGALPPPRGGSPAARGGGASNSPPPGFSSPTTGAANQQSPAAPSQQQRPQLWLQPQPTSAASSTSSSYQQAHVQVCPRVGLPLFQYSPRAASTIFPDGIFAGCSTPTMTPQPTSPPPLPSGVTTAFTDETSHQEPPNDDDTTGASTTTKSSPDDASIAFASGNDYGRNKNQEIEKEDSHQPTDKTNNTTIRGTDDDTTLDSTKQLVRTIVRESIQGSPFHVVLLEKLQKQQSSTTTSASNNGMTLTEVLSVLLKFPDLLNLFCRVQSKHKVPPQELLLELSNIELRKDDELFYYCDSSGKMPVAAAAAAAAPAENENNSNTIDGPAANAAVEEENAGERQQQQQSSTNQQSSTTEGEEDAAYGGELGSLKLGTEDTVILSSSTSGDTDDDAAADLGSGGGMGNSVADASSSTAPTTNHHNSTSSIAQSPSSLTPSSTSPTTVTTSASSSMDMEEEEEEDDTVPPQEFKKHQQQSSKGKGKNCDNNKQSDDELALVRESDIAKPATTTANDTNTNPTMENCKEVSAESIVAQEDRNDHGHVDEDRHEDNKGKGRDNNGTDDDARQIDEMESTDCDTKNNAQANHAGKPFAGKTTDIQLAESSQTKTASQHVVSPNKNNRTAKRAKMMPSLRPQTTLRPDHQKPPLPYHIRTSTNALAALEFLCILHKECQKTGEATAGTWPESQMQLKMFLTKITNCCFSKNAQGDPKEKLPQLFRAWFQDIMKQYKKDPKRLSKIRKTATSQLTEQFEQMECVTTTTDTNFQWNHRKVDALVKGYHKQREMDDSNGKDKRNSTTGTVSSRSSTATRATDETATAKIQASTEKEEMMTNSTKNLNIWQNQRKVEALVHGYNPKDRLGPSPKTSQKVDLSLVKLKKPSRPSFEKSILSTSLPNTTREQRILSTSDSPWKVAPPGPLRTLKPKQDGVVSEAQKSSETHQQRSPPNILRPLHPVIVQSVPPPPPPPPTPPIPANPENEQKGNNTKDEMPLPKASRQLDGADNLPLKSKSNQEVSSGHKQSGSPVQQLASSRLGQWKGAFQQVQSRATRDAEHLVLSQLGLDIPKSIPSPTTAASSFHPDNPHGLLPPTPLETTNKVPALLDLLPEDLAAELSDPTLQQQLTDIILDKGRQPVVWAAGERKFLGGGEGRVVNCEEIHCIVEKLGGFGNSNRIGLDQQLHSVSAIRNRKNDIIGLSMRVGRHITGIATMVSDLLFMDATKSILFLGEPGSGKTTILREVTRLLAKQSDVMIVDTVNEIAGDGDVPHPSVGQARRMMVPSLTDQGSVMMECIQNHSPEVMVVDKLSNPDEVAAALAAKDSGTRLIASMNGNLQKLVKNTKLQGLLGVETVFLRQSIARNDITTSSTTGGGSVGGHNLLTPKTVLHRTGAPAFDLVVELCPGTHHEWKIVLDASNAVDTILQGGKHQCQHRIRHPGTGAITLKNEDA